MCFEWRAGRWQVVYRELNVWPFPRTNRFSSPNRLRDIYDRFGVTGNTVDREMFEFGLQVGRGMVELELTPEQYAKLKEEPESGMV